MIKNNYKEFLNKNLDILKEIGNIGMSHSATSLSQMLGMKVTVTIPEIHILSSDDIETFFNEKSEGSIGVKLNLQADSKGIILQILTRSFAAKIINFFFQGNIEVLEELDEMSLSVVQEIGNITSGSYCNSLASMTGLFIDISPPSHCPDILQAASDEKQCHTSEYFLVINNSLFIGSEEIKSDFLFIPDEQTTEMILSKLKEYYGFSNDGEF